MGMAGRWIAALLMALTLPGGECGAPGDLPAWREVSVQARLSYRLRGDTPVDPELQAALEEMDRRIGKKLGIPDSHRAFGVLDLTGLHLAMVRPDEIFYGASVPKIGILLSYFETHPEAARDLPEEVERELQLMIKRSSNEMAAKYSQLVGLKTIQKILQSDRYRLYDRELGGGLWCGKHYGIPEPRTGDPLGGQSHAATVRQCLRFYLMLEQGRLVSPAACRKMEEIFAAPGLEFFNSSFVAGLRGRGASLIRKSGLWEDWHLDTARVRHGERVYLLAGMAHHPGGREYLAALAAEMDEVLCGPSAPQPFSHELHIQELQVNLQGGSGYTSPVLEAGEPFNEALLSWNADLPPGGGISVELRVGRRFQGFWSPYLHVGDWGEVKRPEEKTISFDEGKIDVDYFRSEKRFDRIQYRVRAFRKESPGGKDREIRLARVGLCLSDTTGIPGSRPPVARKDPPGPPPEKWQRRLPVPFRSQRDEDPEIAGHICSPTSVSMVLEYRGVNRPTAEVAARIYDPVHKIYGNWPRAVQGAYSYGVPGYLARFSSWNSVKRMIARGQPLIISIRAQEGELTGAPYPKTAGHLLVLAGFDRKGDVLVNDPAARTREKGQCAYLRRELEKVWMEKGGTAYVLLPGGDP